MTKNLFLFTGAETYLLYDQIKAWKAAFLEKHGDLNLEVLDAKQTPLNEIMAAVSALPFLGEKRLIFIYGLPEAPKTRNADKMSKADEKRDEELKKFVSDLDSIPETSVLVFVQENPDKRKSFYKQLLKKAELKEFAPLTGMALVQWIQQRVQQKSAQIDYPTAEYLASLAGQNLWRLSTEIDKLCVHSPSEKLSKQIIDQLVIPSIEANVFQLTDALAAQDAPQAIYHLHRTLAAGENLQPVFYMMVRQFRLLLQGSSFLEAESNPSPTTFTAKLKIHPFVAKNTLNQAKYFKTNSLKIAYKQLLDIDADLKSSRIKVLTDDQSELALALERFILEFCR